MFLNLGHQLAKGWSSRECGIYECQQNGSWPPNLFPLMTFRLISLYMGSPLSRIYTIIYDCVFPRFPIPGSGHSKYVSCSFIISWLSRWCISNCISINSVHIKLVVCEFCEFKVAKRKKKGMEIHMRAKHNIMAPVMAASPPAKEDTVTCTMRPVTPPAVPASSQSSNSCNCGWPVPPCSPHLGLKARKPVFGDLRTTQAQTSLRIRAVWSAPLLFAFWKVSYVNLL